MTMHGDRLARRDFVGRVLGGVAAATVLPALPAVAASPRRLWLIRADDLTGVAADEEYWRLVKDQFPLKPGSILVNAANLCPSPYVVSEAVSSLTRDIDSDASFQNRAKFSELREKARAAVAAFLGAAPEEIAFTRNTTESNNTVVNGFNLKAGDEVVIWDQNHPTNNVAWDERARRFGFTVVKVKTPPAPKTRDELLKAFRDALTAKTKVLAITHVSSSSGVGLPAKELCALARSRGILSLVDGAQTFGAVELNLHDMGCDFFTGSAHKWFMGPKEVGVLYVRAERATDLWPDMVGVGWQSAKDRGARKFETLGQRDDAAMAAMGTAVDFHRSIGEARIAARVRELATAMKAGLQQKIANLKFHTPVDPDLSGGIVIFSWPGLDPAAASAKLYEGSRVGCATTGGDFAGLRYSPHIYNTMEDVEKAVAAAATLVTA